jgi:hypothetical protein
MQPHIHTPTLPPPPVDETYPETEFPTEEGTLEAHPPHLAHTAEIEAPHQGILWLILAATCAGLIATGVLLFPGSGPGSIQVQEPWMVLRMQSEALNAPDNTALEREAIAAGEAFLQAEPDSPWRVIIEENQGLLVAPATER